MAWRPRLVSPVLNGISIILPSRWGVAAAAASINLRGIAPGPATNDRLWQHSTGQWVWDMIILTALGVAFLCLAIRVLSKRLNSPD